MLQKEKKQPSLIAYHVTTGKKGYWAKIGAAWDHKDGQGLTLQLDMLPLAPGSIVLRQPLPPLEDDATAETAAPAEPESALETIEA